MGRAIVSIRRVSRQPAGLCDSTWATLPRNPDGTYGTPQYQTLTTQQQRDLDALINSPNIVTQAINRALANATGRTVGGSGSQSSTNTAGGTFQYVARVTGSARQGWTGSGAIPSLVTRLNANGFTQVDAKEADAGAIWYFVSFQLLITGRAPSNITDNGELKRVINSAVQESGYDIETSDAGFVSGNPKLPGPGNSFLDQINNFFKTAGTPTLVGLGVLAILILKD
jgi:hypothetical protein